MKNGNNSRVKMAPRTREVLLLYKQLLKESNLFPTYMYKTYALRRIKDAFKEHRNETDSEKINGLIEYGRKNLEIIKRQVLIGQLFRSPEGVYEKELKSKEKVLPGG